MEIKDEITQLKNRRKAVILAHNYQPGEIQDLADFTGDSLGLSREASKTNADVIVFCGVQFMAETAAVLSPGKTVLLPEKTAGCPMADMITEKQLLELKKEHPNALVVCYVNSPVEVKAVSDYCCTSANAVDIVESLPEGREIIFVPDRHLGQHAVDQTGRDMILWPGYCPSHVVITPDDITRERQKHPEAVVMVHAECTEAVKNAADEILSTSQMLKFVEKSPAEAFIVGTEIGILHPLKKQRPDAQFIPASSRAVCPNMKKISLEKILWSLEDMEPVVTVEPDIRERAVKSLERMVQALPHK